MMIPPLPLRLTSGGLVKRVLCAVVFGAALTASASPWDDMTSGLFNESHAEFVKEQKHAKPEDLRTLRFGEATSLLNVQPRTESNIDKAYGIFEEIIRANPADDLALEARYMQGRIDQVQRPTPDLAKAEATFADLAANQSTHLVGQRALVKLALIRLYAPVDAAERRRRYDELSIAATKVTDPGVTVQINLLLGEVARRVNYGTAEELKHYLAAEKAGVVKRRLLGDVYIRIADLARLEGKNDIAIDYYTRFLEQFPRTDRRTTVENLLAALKKSS